MNWNETIILTFKSGHGKYNQDAVKMVVPISGIKGLKQGIETDYGAVDKDKPITLVVLDGPTMLALNFKVPYPLGTRIEEVLHEFKVEEEFKVVYELLKGSPAARILHGQ